MNKMTTPRTMDYKRFIFQPAGRAASLEAHDADHTGDFRNEDECKTALQSHSDDLAKYQDILAAHERRGLLLIFQGMDGAGKDAAIKHVMRHADPQNCRVKMFKEPSRDERKHDYLRAAATAIPARGEIGIFNRSYYEHLIADRARPEKLAEQNLPGDLTRQDIWKRRYRHVNEFERYLADEGIAVLKFYLHISEETQREKLLERIERTDKKWKFSMSDIEDRALWDEYQKIYTEVFKNTATKIAPWHIIPANNRWFARAVIAAVVTDKLKAMHARYPSPDEKTKKELKRAEKILRA